jgi:catechol 2,3-dioxygenase-like lactoylglutathione lyase family enzyme
MAHHDWPRHLPVGALRLVRPCARLDACRSFYHGLLGLPIISQFTDYDGHGGVLLGLPGEAMVLELLNEKGAPPPFPHSSDQLVLYLPDAPAADAAAWPLAAGGHALPGEEGEYWTERGATRFVDPCGYTLVVAPWVFGHGRPPTRRLADRRVEEAASE